MTASPDEQVALFDTEGRVVGSARRSVVRASNLPHGATAIVVRDRHGRVYVHRRTPTKDVYPGLLDFCAGGVIQAGEEPAECAVREAEEELGVSGVALVPVAEGRYSDARTTYHAFLFLADYDGPIRWQPEEVAWGRWLRIGDLLRHLDDAPEDFVPDSPALWRDRLPALA